MSITWMDIEDITINEISQSQNDIYYMTAFMRYLRAVKL